MAMTPEEEKEIADDLIDWVERYLPFTADTAKGYAEELPDWDQLTPDIQAAIIRGMLYGSKIDTDYLVDQLDANGLHL